MASAPTRSEPRAGEGRAARPDRPRPTAERSKAPLVAQHERSLRTEHEVWSRVVELAGGPAPHLVPGLLPLPFSARDLAAACGLERSAVQAHLKTMVEAGALFVQQGSRVGTYWVRSRETADAVGIAERAARLLVAGRLEGVPAPGDSLPTDASPAPSREPTLLPWMARSLLVAAKQLRRFTPWEAAAAAPQPLGLERTRRACEQLAEAGVFRLDGQSDAESASSGGRGRDPVYLLLLTTAQAGGVLTKPERFVHSVTDEMAEGLVRLRRRAEHLVRAYAWASVEEGLRGACDELLAEQTDRTRCTLAGRVFGYDQCGHAYWTAPVAVERSIGTGTAVRSAPTGARLVGPESRRVLGLYRRLLLDVRGGSSGPVPSAGSTERSGRGPTRLHHVYPREIRIEAELVRVLFGELRRGVFPPLCVPLHVLCPIDPEMAYLDHMQRGVPHGRVTVVP